MDANRSRFAAYRPFILWGSVLGLGMVAILASVSVARGNDGFALAVIAATGWPFVLGLLALVRETSLAVRRWLLLLAAVGAAVVGFPLIFNGAGFWFFAIAIAYAWVWWGTRNASA